jgi:holin-like protein
MLQGVFIIFLFQLIGETVQKYFALTIPGPVIGLVLLLLALLLLERRGAALRERFEKGLEATSATLLGHLPLLFVPIGVGVVMHITVLEGHLLAVLGVIFVGTVSSIGVTALVMQKLQNMGKRHDR